MTRCLTGGPPTVAGHRGVYAPKNTQLVFRCHDARSNGIWRQRPRFAAASQGSFYFKYPIFLSQYLFSHSQSFFAAKNANWRVLYLYRKWFKIFITVRWGLKWIFQK